MTTTLWIAVLLQMVMGAFDTLYHRELTQRVAWKAAHALELQLHGLRNLIYGALFILIGVFRPEGGWALMVLILIAIELAIRLWDFVEQDRTRKLSASERVAHTLLTLNYGIILTMAAPWLIELLKGPTQLGDGYAGVFSWIAMAAAAAVVFGIRDLSAARRCRWIQPAAAAPLATALPGRKAILITGGTGFVGRRLVAALAGAGHRVTVLSRDAEKATDLCDLGEVEIISSLDAIGRTARFYAIINLAGEPISNTLWTRRKRLRIIRSRLRMTRDIKRLIVRLRYRPEVLVSGSAVGFYGLRDDTKLTEASEGHTSFSRTMCMAWESATAPVAALGVRTVCLRMGLVLDHDGGMLARLLLPFELGLGGRFGSGQQWMSWIHRDDLVRLIVHVVADDTIAGPVNATAPNPVRNREFVKVLGHALRRPVMVPIPAAALRKVLGDFAQELLLSGQRVLPQVALDHGFRFRYPDLAGAIHTIAGALHAPRHIGRTEIARHR